MKTFILTAGEGKRIKPIAGDLPKCLLKVKNKALLQIWFDSLIKASLRNVIINTSPYNKPVVDFVYANKPNIRVFFSYENKLLGSAGTIYRNRNLLWGDKRIVKIGEEIKKVKDDFLVVYGDTYTTLNLNRIIEFHRQRNALATIGLFKATNPKECGIVEIADNNIVTNIIEKPDDPKTNLAFAGIMVASQEVFDHMNSSMFDIARDLLPKLVLTKRLFGFVIQETLIDIGTPEGYKKANEESIVNSPNN